MRYLVIATLLLSMAACAPLGEKLAILQKESTKEGESYNQLLASEYLAYSESLAERGHPIRADRFAAKGQAALKGGNVAPEVSVKTDKERQALMLVLTDDLKEVVPAKVARTQLLYDCLADEAASPGKNQSEMLCKESFAVALSELQFIAGTLVHGTNNNFTISFASGSAEISNDAQNVLEIAAGRVKGLGEYKVELITHEKPGASSKFKLLTHERVLAVEQGLIAKGVDAGRIENKPAVASKEVVLSIDNKTGNPDAIDIDIKTFAPASGKTP